MIKGSEIIFNWLAIHPNIALLLLFVIIAMIGALACQALWTKKAYEEKKEDKKNLKIALNEKQSTEGEKASLQKQNKEILASKKNLAEDFQTLQESANLLKKVETLNFENGTLKEKCSKLQAISDERNERLTLLIKKASEKNEKLKEIIRELEQKLQIHQFFESIMNLGGMKIIIDDPRYQEAITEIALERLEELSTETQPKEPDFSDLDETLGLEDDQKKE